VILLYLALIPLVAFYGVYGNYLGARYSEEPWRRLNHGVCCLIALFYLGYDVGRVMELATK
jgi:hypothetical protein